MTRTRIVPTLLLFVLCFSLSFNAYASRHRGRSAASARAERRGRKGREVAERGRGGRAARAKTPAHETRAERRRREREEARADRRGGRRLSRRERLLQARREAEARRRAELARLAAIARARAIEQALRNQVAANIAKDDTTGEDLEVRRAAVNALGNHIATVVVMVLRERRRESAGKARTHADEVPSSHRRGKP